MRVRNRLGSPITPNGCYTYIEWVELVDVDIRTGKCIVKALEDEDLRKIRSMPDPLAAFDRPEEHMTVYRSDGSSVTIRSEFGTVQITDTRKRGTMISMDADQFLSCFLH
jgi:hypothetical protein